MLDFNRPFSIILLATLLLSAAHGMKKQDTVELNGAGYLTEKLKVSSRSSAALCAAVSHFVPAIF